MSASWALPWDYAGGRPHGSGGDTKVILLVTFVDWAKKIVMDGRTNKQTNERTETWTDRLVGRNSDLEISYI